MTFDDPDAANEQRDQADAKEEARDEPHRSLDGMDDLGIEHGTETFLVGQLTGLGGDRAGDLLDLLSRRQIVLDDDELAFQFARDLEDGREDHDDRPVLLAGGDRRVECLDDLDAAQEPSARDCPARPSRNRMTARVNDEHQKFQALPQLPSPSGVRKYPQRLEVLER